MFKPVEGNKNRYALGLLAGQCSVKVKTNFEVLLSTVGERKPTSYFAFMPYNYGETFG